MNTAQKGANFERTLLNKALEKGAVLALRGASSKSRYKLKDLKIDLVIVKGSKIYFIQAKHHKHKATSTEKQAFYKAAQAAGLHYSTLYAETAFIEDFKQFDILMGE
jgi:Holliday junction resolvase